MNSSTPGTETEKLKALGDTLITATVMELERSGMSAETVLDRLGTCFAGHYAKVFGKAAAAKVLRHMAKRVEGGAFDFITGEGARD